MKTFTHLLSLTLFIYLITLSSINAQIVNVGSGSYTTTFPGTDVAGRNAFPPGAPQLSGAALGRPVPTNDWWSRLVRENHAGNLFNYPFTMSTVNNGLVVSYIPRGPIDDQLPVIVGVTDLATTRSTVSNFSDWTVTMNWNDGTRNFEATSGIGMPFIYFTKGNNDVAQVTVNLGTVVVDNEMIIITNARNGADFVIYAPVGSTWTQTGNVYTSTLNGKNYWSMAFIPLTATNVAAVANEYKRFAYVFPVNTTVSYSFNETTSVVRTDFTVQTEVKEGTAQNMLLGLLPHQWANLASNSPQPLGYSYATIRGELKTLEGNSFSVENTFKGILPTLPFVNNQSQGFNPAALNEKISAIENDGLPLWTDSYNEGQSMNRLIQTARVAHEIGNFAARDKMVETVRLRLEDWLTAESGEVAFIFFYNAAWSALLGYPAGHGQDHNINDHHFHWGYFIHAAAFVEQFQPGWANRFGAMVNLLVRDAATTNPNDPLFPRLRNFSPYAGHSWANGFATFPQGNDQESTSESMQFNSALIHWGTITGNDSIRDLGIYLYTTEQTAIEEYWLDVYDRNFPATQQFSLVSRVWGNNLDNGTFWTADIAASYGIQLYPIHGGSLYLGHNTAYATRLWNEIKANTGIMSNQVNPNLWHDLMWKFAAFTNPAEALTLYYSNPNRSLKFGTSNAQTYYWLHAMNALGQVQSNVTANHPIAAVFSKNGEKTYVAHNYGNSPITVTFSDGFQLIVPARTMKTNKDVSVKGQLTTSFAQAGVGGSVELSVVITEGTATKVEFMRGLTSVGTVNSAPFRIDATQLSPGIHSFYARIFEGENFNTTNIVSVIVGNQLPFEELAWAIPGTIEAGEYDIFEGGRGQNISYFDLSPQNEGNFRMNESVDASLSTTEGATIGWIDAGEWVEYSINVAENGLYSLAFRYASAAQGGGGPFSLEVDGQVIASNITVPATSGWNTWATRTINNIPLTAGNHILRVKFLQGGFNLGRLTFTRMANLGYSVPIANAGSNLTVILPQTTTTLVGSGSTESEGKVLTFEWVQIYGSSIVEFSNTRVANPDISNLKEGLYRFRLLVSNPEGRVDSDEVLVMVTSTTNVLPTVSISAPANNAVFRQVDPVTITATASDFDGTIQKVDFYQNNILIGTDTTAPFAFVWNPGVGQYSLTAIATDNLGGVSTSNAVNIRIDPVMICTQTSREASQGTFSIGYRVTFETVGTNVNITFELLDTDRAGLVAYLWRREPFGETPKRHVSGRIFTSTIGGLTPGSTISYACKFAFAGGMAVTRYFDYVVGTHCIVTSVDRIVLPEAFFYPNPVQDVVRFEVGNDETTLNIYDIAGNKVFSEIIPSTFSLNVSHFSPGVYFVVAESNSKIQQGKFIKK